MSRSYSEIKMLNRDLSVIQRKINIREKEFIKESGFNVTHRELEYIVIIKDFKGNKLKDALETLDVSKSTWSNQLKTLVQKDIIKLEIDNQDKRVKRPYLTIYGKKIYNLHKKVRELFLKKYVGYLTDKEIDNLFIVIKKILVAVKENNR